VKILHIITGLKLGGAESTLYRLVKADSENSHTVVSLSNMDHYGDKLQSLGVEVIALRLSPVTTISALLLLRRTMRRIAPDAIQTWMYHADFVGGIGAKLSVRAPVLWCIRRSNTTNHKKLSVIWWLLRLNALLSQFIPSTIICCADSAKQSHTALGYARRKLHVIYNGFDTELLKPDATARTNIRTEFNVTPSEILFGSVGRWIPEKGYEGLLKALANLNTHQAWKYLMVGNGLDNENTELMQLIKHHGLQDHVIPCGPRSDISGVMSALDVNVLPSLGEGFPNVVAEAMACGTPCLVTDVGDAANIVADTGWVVPAGDIPAMTTGIEHCISATADASWQQRCEQSRQRIIDNFSTEKMLSSYLARWAGNE